MVLACYSSLANHRNQLQIYTQTCKHHHVLEVGADLVFAAQVQQEGEGVDVRSSAQKHSQLGGEVSRSGYKKMKLMLHWQHLHPNQNHDILPFLSISKGSVNEKVVLGHWFLGNTMSCNTLDISLNTSQPLPWWH